MLKLSPTDGTFITSIRRSGVKKIIGTRCLSGSAGVLHREWPQLTVRELETLQLLAKGYSYEDIGKALELSINTVGTHVRHIYRKLEVRSKGAAILEAIRLRIAPDPGSSRR